MNHAEEEFIQMVQNDYSGNVKIEVLFDVRNEKRLRFLEGRWAMSIKLLLGKPEIIGPSLEYPVELPAFGFYDPNFDGKMAEALIDYLKNGRPQTTERRFFIRVIAPQGPIGNGGVASSVALYLQKAGIKVHRGGSHTLRHTCVQRLIDAEFPLKTIGDYVGHRRSQSTEVYTKVAIATLREVAMGDGEAL